MFFGCLKTWIQLTEDHVIPCLRDYPAHQENWYSQLIFEVLDILERIGIVVYLNVNPCPRLTGERAI